MGYPIAVNNSVEPLRFLLVLTSDHITGATGKTPTVLIAKNLGSFAAPLGAVTEIGNGWYQVAPNTADANTLGPVLLHATAAACDPRDDEFIVVNYNPTAFSAVSVSAGASPYTTARDLIARALRLIGALAQGESPSDQEEQDAWFTLNELVESWALQRLTMATISWTAYTLTANQSTYTIGESGTADFAAIRPSVIEGAALQLMSGPIPVQLAIPVLTDQAFADLSIPTMTSPLFTALYYSPTVPDGTITIWPVPTTAANPLLLGVPQPVLRFVNLTSSYALAPGYLRALRYNLALELAPEFGKPVDPVIAQIAGESLRAVKLQNVRMSDLELNTGFEGGGWYNIYTGP